MRSLKNHLGFLLPLIALLFAVEFSITSDKIVKNYEALMGRDYNIVIVSLKELTDTDIKPVIKSFLSLEQLSAQKIIDRLADDISAKNLSILQNALPKFYSLKLSEFPTPKTMNEIKDKIQKMEGISKVETFSSTHDKVYKILNLTKMLSNMFMWILAFVGSMLMFKQARIWLYEHKERIEIMTLFGAPFWLKSAMLYRIAVIDSILSSILVSVFFYFLPDIEFFNSIAKEIDVAVPRLNFEQEPAMLFGVAIALSIFTVSLVMRRVKKDNI
ncbi:cell division protein FtsX [Campylobacter sp. RM9328]|uniref:cell division protein FtsX n=1 Tax=Campylobacter sp. RM9328 TaxID=1705720 RepID=UPI00147411BA|nr:cell division protein FtsX [Campylobacter sp. RM9328]